MLEKLKALFRKKPAEPLTTSIPTSPDGQNTDEEEFDTLPELEDAGPYADSEASEEPDRASLEAMIIDDDDIWTYDSKEDPSLIEAVVTPLTGDSPIRVDYEPPVQENEESVIQEVVESEPPEVAEPTAVESDESNSHENTEPVVEESVVDESEEASTLCKNCDHKSKDHSKKTGTCAHCLLLDGSVCHDLAV